MRFASFVAISSLAVLVCSGASAGTITLKMNEVGTQLIDGLTVSKGGEDFTFSDPSGTLSYKFVGPGSLTYVQDPSIVGANVPFSVTFSVPVTGISFGLAEDTGDALSGASVTLSDASVHLFDLSLTDPFAEGQFVWSGSAVTGFSLTPVQGPDALAFDNLRVTVPTLPVPEPSSIGLLGAGLAGLAGLRLLRRKPA